jgi:hypothetical protein
MAAYTSSSANRRLSTYFSYRGAVYIGVLF